MRYRRDDPAETWEGMKEKFRLKYIPLFFSQQLLDKWNRLTQENKSATDYITNLMNTGIGAVPSSLNLSNRHYLGLDQVLGMTTAESS